MPDYKLQNYSFTPELNLRCVLWDDGEPWFVAPDVCRAIGHSNPTVAVQSLDSDEVRKLNLGIGNSGHNIINESGLYALLMRSRKPDARKFRKWVTSEVLPSIRKTGGYVTVETAQAMMDDPEVMLCKALQFATERLKQEELKNVKLTAKNEVLAVQGKGLEAVDIPTYTVKEFCALRRLSVPGNLRKKIGRLAAGLADVAGRQKTYRSSLFPGPDGELRQGTVVVHTVAALERVFESLKMAHTKTNTRKEFNVA